MDSTSPLEKHLISLYVDYDKLLLFGHTHGVSEDEYFKEHLEKLRRRHCHFCSITFNSSQAADDHKKDKHPQYTQWTCTTCNKNFSQKRLLVRHQKTHKKILRCQLCNFICDNLNVFRTHVKMCQIACDFCNQTFSKKDAYDKHIKFDHEKVTCDDCGKQISSRRSLLRHSKLVHKNSSPLAIRFSCKVSYIFVIHVFISIINQFLFIIPHHDILFPNCLVYYLQFCDAVFNSMDDLNKHTATGQCTSNQDWKDIYTEYEIYNNQQDMDLETGAIVEIESESSSKVEQETDVDEREEEEMDVDEGEEKEDGQEERGGTSDHTYALPTCLNLDGTVKSEFVIFLFQFFHIINAYIII